MPELGPRVARVELLQLRAQARDLPFVAGQLAVLPPLGLLPPGDRQLEIVRLLLHPAYYRVQLPVLRQILLVFLAQLAYSPLVLRLVEHGCFLLARQLLQLHEVGLEPRDPPVQLPDLVLVLAGPQGVLGGHGLTLQPRLLQLRLENRHLWVWNVGSVARALNSAGLQVFLAQRPLLSCTLCWLDADVVVLRTVSALRSPVSILRRSLHGLFPQPVLIVLEGGDHVELVEEATKQREKEKREVYVELPIEQIAIYSLHLRRLELREFIRLDVFLI